MKNDLLNYLKSKCNARNLIACLISVVVLFFLCAYVIMTPKTQKMYSLMKEAKYEFNHPTTVQLEAAYLVEHEEGNGCEAYCMISAENSYGQRLYGYYIVFDNGAVMEASDGFLYDFVKRYSEKSNVNKKAINFWLGNKF